MIKALNGYYEQIDPVGFDECFNIGEKPSPVKNASWRINRSIKRNDWHFLTYPSLLKMMSVKCDRPGINRHFCLGVQYTSKKHNLL